jgi:hypothetical protein
MAVMSFMFSFPPDDGVAKQARPALPGGAYSALVNGDAVSVAWANALPAKTRDTTNKDVAKGTGFMRYPGIVVRGCTLIHGTT